MTLIDYSKIPFTERRSTGEYIKENSFYMPRCEENPDGYDSMDFFGLMYKHGLEDHKKGEKNDRD